MSFRKGPSGHSRQDPSEEAKRIKDNPSLQDKSPPQREDLVKTNARSVVLHRGGDVSDKQEGKGSVPTAPAPTTSTQTEAPNIPQSSLALLPVTSPQSTASTPPSGPPAATGQSFSGCPAVSTGYPSTQLKKKHAVPPLPSYEQNVSQWYCSQQQRIWMKTEMEALGLWPGSRPCLQIQQSSTSRSTAAPGSRTRVPHPKELLERVESVLQRLFLECNPDGVPLFKPLTLKVWRIQRVHIFRGCLSDPEVVEGILCRHGGTVQLNHVKVEAAAMPVWIPVRDTSQQ
ncbi:hypothetical protein DPX16_3278 [Anabarilius grahami]|uniref:Uncharacterized protein n=1 Tax=Anabarilius grahami TaxID=495550 RepID=A0A3N0XPJ5_ANAGA|nr:hypothetical protein DPX16_3278 [Anabarilius grahami]